MALSTYPLGGEPMVTGAGFFPHDVAGMDQEVEGFGSAFDRAGLVTVGSVGDHRQAGQVIPVTGAAYPRQCRWRSRSG